MRIAHISDIHLNSDLRKNNIGKTKKLINLALEIGFDHLVITGDISDNSNEKDFVIFRKILKTFDLLDSRKTSIVIGNHDIFGGVQTVNDVLNFPSKCLKTDFHEKVRQFGVYFAELFENCSFSRKDLLFPYSKYVNDVQLIGINTIDFYSRIKNPFASNGKIYRDQFNAIKTLLSQTDEKIAHKVVLSHHHFYKNTEEATSSNPYWKKIECYTLKLRGKKKLINMFSENKVKLVLHGHSHEIREYYRKGIKFINAGGSLDNSFSEASSILIIDTDKNYETEVYRLENNLIYGNSLLSSELLVPSHVA